MKILTSTLLALSISLATLMTITVYASENEHEHEEASKSEEHKGHGHMEKMHTHMKMMKENIDNNGVMSLEMKDATQILKRHPKNPLLHIKDFPGSAQIYNPSPIMYADETILLISVVFKRLMMGLGAFP